MQQTIGTQFYVKICPEGTNTNSGADCLPTPMSNATEVISAGAYAGKYLTVILGNETYGIPVMKVREIIRMQKITPVPQMPPYVRGIINLRGRMFPIVDLRLKFGLKAEFADRTCIIVVQVRVTTGQNVSMGLIVDSVEEVTNLAAGDIEPPPNFGAEIDYLFGIAKTKGQVKMLLDIDKVIAPEAAKTIVPVADAQAPAQPRHPQQPPWQSPQPDSGDGRLAGLAKGKESAQRRG